MVWYIPPLSPVVDAVSRDGHDGEDLGNLFGALEALRIPIGYLAGLFTAGDTGTVEAVLRRLAAMRSSCVTSTLVARPSRTSRPGRDDRGADVRDVPAARHREIRGALLISSAYAADEGHALEETGCSLSFDGGPGMYQSGPFGEASGGPVPSRWKPSTRSSSGRPEKAWPPTRTTRPG